MTLRETVGLRKIRRERIAIWFWVISYLPVVLIVRGVDSFASMADGPITFIWIVALLGTLFRVIFSRCPHCGGQLLFNRRPAREASVHRQMHAMRTAAQSRARMYPSLE